LEAFSHAPDTKSLPTSWRLPGLRRPSSARGLSREQQAAVAAMASPGGCLIWAVPGADKAVVVAAAVAAAVAKGRTVLLTAPDGQAIDAALTALIAADQAGRAVLKPGVVVRLPYDDIAEAVDDHPFLMDDKAAAALVQRDQRLAAITRTEQSNQDDPVRSTELWLRLRVQDDDKDGALRLLDEQRVIYDEWLDWTNHRTLLRHERDELLDSIKATEKTLATYDGTDTRVTALSADLASERRQRDNRLQQVQTLTAQLDVATRQRATRQAQLSEIQGRGPEWDDQRASLENSIDELSDLIDDLGADLRRPREDLATHEARAASIEQRLGDALSVQEARDTVQQRLADLHREVDLRALEMRDCEQEMAVRRRVLGDPPAWLVRYQEAESAGRFTPIHRWSESAQQVSQLDAELVRLGLQRAQVEDDYERRWWSLPAEAPVVAAPLDAVVLEDGLVNRRFDVVIIDDAGEADAAKVSYVASLANRTCAIVGGPPIAPTAAATTPEEPYPWRVNGAQPAEPPEPQASQNIFALAGITDRASAEKHPRCLVLA